MLKIFESFVDKGHRILEIGGGTGFIAQKLLESGYSIEMADIHSNALHIAKSKGIKRLYQFDLYNPPFTEAFDVICLFDVLEHCHDNQKALMTIKTMLKPGGKLILSVPAHKWLWSHDDVLSGHNKRYKKKDFFELYKACDLIPLSTQYFFLFITPFLLLRSLVRRKGRDKQEVNFDLPPLVNRVFQGLTSLESVLSPYLPNGLGGSLFSVSKKAS